MGQVYSWLMFGVVGFTPAERREEMLSVDSADYVPSTSVITMLSAAVRRIRLSKSGDTVPGSRRCPRIKYCVRRFPMQILLRSLRGRV
jgi:hypothetical protein